MTVTNVVYTVMRHGTPLAGFSSYNDAMAWSREGDLIHSSPFNPPPSKKYWHVMCEPQEEPMWTVAVVNSISRPPDVRPSITSYGTFEWVLEAESTKDAIKKCKGYLTQYIQRD